MAPLSRAPGVHPFYGRHGLLSKALVVRPVHVPLRGSRAALRLVSKLLVERPVCRRRGLLRKALPVRPVHRYLGILHRRRALHRRLAGGLESTLLPVSLVSPIVSVNLGDEILCNYGTTPSPSQSDLVALPLSGLPSAVLPPRRTFRVVREWIACVTIRRQTRTLDPEPNPLRFVAGSCSIDARDFRRCTSLTAHRSQELVRRSTVEFPQVHSRPFVQTMK